MSCVNINSREFKTLLDEVNISSSALELIIHKIQNSENSDRFPSAEEVNNLLKPKSFTGDHNMIEVWEKQYSSPINFPTLILANEEYNNAVKIFGKDSVSIVERKNGTYDLIVGNPTFESEYKYILSNAKRDSEGNLLAPNGKKSNLNERQYAQVRTKAFKDWFGDWENNPSQASKVVDENGEPLVVWHGGRKPTIFDTSGKQSGGAGIQKGIKGSYFITTKEQAKHYAGIAEYKQGDVLFELSQQLQLEVESGEITEEEANTIWNKNQIGVTSYFLNIRNPKINEYKYNVIVSKIDKDGHIFRKESREVEELSSVTPTNFDGQNIRIYHPEYKSFAYPINEYKTYKQKDEIEWVATNPNQIKSATDNIGTYSTTNDDVRYSSVTEQPIKVPSVTSFAERLQVQQQPKFASLVARGEISTSCR